MGSAMRELKVRSVKCSVKSVGCGVLCGVWIVEYRVWRVVLGGGSSASSLR